MQVHSPLSGTLNTFVRPQSCTRHITTPCLPVCTQKVSFNNRYTFTTHLTHI
uniref:Uncharacterized protein n=1 Tax=Anguilla anguilla TaxID=7936 RepID=A0A0E9WW19_ANGAN